MLTDIQIAQQADIRPIREVAAAAGIPEDALELYGNYKAKITNTFVRKTQERRNGKLVLVTAMNPTPMGEGKTTVTIGLGQALNRIGKKTFIALREPSLGPVMGIKGGATGGGYSQVLPMEDINLHFTGDLHAVTAANNLLAAVVDNHIYQDNTLEIDVHKVFCRRCIDMNDRSLRHIVIGLGGAKQGIPREDGFVITVATEVMAILCLAEGFQDLKERLSRMIVAYNKSGMPVTVGDLKVQGAMALLLKDAVKPNLIQTIENTPALMHGGPFANIAHGCNSVTATKLGLKLGEYCITEAGFGADLGAEKFFDIKCRQAGLKPDAAVIVVSIRALKHHGHGDLTEGLANLGKHIENVHKFRVPPIVAVNQFADDTDAQLRLVQEYCAERGTLAALCNVHAQGGAGGIALAEALVALVEEGQADFRPLYDTRQPVKDKILCICQEIYGADAVEYSQKADEAIANIEALGYGDLPICMSKTQYSFSDKAKLLGRPEHFTVSVSEVTLSAGAGFIVVMTGSVLAMPGLPKVPSAQQLDIYEDGTIVGLF